MRFEIFKTGTHTSDKGITKSYNEEDLENIIQSFNEDKDGVPVVVGHPSDNSPAYAWMDKVEMVDDTLFAETKDDNPDFIDAVKKKTYKNRSISLTPDGKLRHVGFLGGAAPAVKGLAPVSFASPQSVLFEMDLPEIEFEEIADDNFNEEENLPNADNNNSDESSAKESKSNDSRSENISFLKEAFSPVAESLGQMKISLDKMNSNFSEGINSLSEDEMKKVYDKMSEINFRIKVSEFELMLNEKLAYGSLTPAMKQKIMSLIQYLNSQNFSDDFSARQYQDNINTLISDLINSIPKIIHYENFAEKPENENNSIKEEDYGGLSLDEDSSKLHKDAVALMEKEEITYLSAINKLSRPD